MYNELLLNAIANDDVEAVRSLLEKVFDLDGVLDEFGNSALMSAAWGKCEKVAELLIKKGVNVNVQNKYGETALIIASKQNCAEIVKLLLKNDADVNAREEDGCSALMFAICNGHAEIANLLLEGGADVDVNVKAYGGVTALMIASQHNHIEIVRLLLRKNANVNTPSENGCSALMFASQRGCAEIVRLLLEGGADVNAQDRMGCSALMFASKYGTAEIVNLLLEGGAKVNAQNHEGWNALMFASQYGCAKNVNLLLRKNADVNAQNERKENALMIASHRGCTEIVNLLLEGGADVDARSDNGWNALMLAIRRNKHTKIVELLLRKNADVNAKDGNGVTALMRATYSDHVETIKLLLENENLMDGWGALAFAIRTYVEIVRMLLEKGADVNAQKNDGETALMIAIQYGRAEIANLLLKKGADIYAKNCNGKTIFDFACNDLRIREMLEKMVVLELVESRVFGREVRLEDRDLMVKHGELVRKEVPYVARFRVRLFLHVIANVPKGVIAHGSDALKLAYRGASEAAEIGEMGEACKMKVRRFERKNAHEAIQRHENHGVNSLYQYFMESFVDFEKLKWLKLDLARILKSENLSEEDALFALSFVNYDYVGAYEFAIKSPEAASVLKIEAFIEEMKGTASEILEELSSMTHAARVSLSREQEFGLGF